MVMPDVKPPAGLPVVVHALLKPRWEWQPKQHRIATRTQEVATAEKVPVGAEISYLVERLRNVASPKLSAAEKKLARWVQIRLPPRADAEATLSEIAGWPCTAEVRLAPIMSLPWPATGPTR